MLANKRMAKPDLPNFSIFGRIFFGVIAILVIVAMIYYFRMTP